MASNNRHLAGTDVPDLSDSINWDMTDETGNGMRATKTKFQDEQSNFCKKARTQENELCEQAESGQQVDADPSIYPEENWLPDELLQLRCDPGIQPDTPDSAPSSDPPADPCEMDTQEQLPGTLSPRGSVINTFVSCILDRLFLELYEEDETIV